MDEETFSEEDDGRTTKLWKNQPSEEPWFIKERMDSNRQETGTPPRRVIEHPHRPTEMPRHHKEMPVALPKPRECIPVSIKDILANPSSTPYDIGEDIVLSLEYDFDPTPPVEPIEWSIWNNTLNDYVLIGTGDTLDYTVADADIFAKNVDGLGLIRFRVNAYNCGSPIPSSRIESFAAQGTPP